MRKTGKNHESCNEDSYVRCLKMAIPEINKMFGHNYWTLQQDNSPVHTAKATQEFLEGKGVNLLLHPPCSPDLNPIEPIWNWMKDKAYTKNFSNFDELIEVIQEVWGMLDNTSINNLIDRHMDRIKDIYDNNGSYIP